MRHISTLLAVIGSFLAIDVNENFNAVTNRVDSVRRDGVIHEGEAFTNETALP